MIRKRKMANENVMPATAKIYRLPGHESAAMPNNDPSDRPVGFWKSRGFETGIIMANTNTPRGWNFNPSNIGVIFSIATFCIAVLGIAVGSAFWVGRVYEKQLQMEIQVQKAAEDADKAKQLESYNAGSTDAQKGHTDKKDTEKKGEKK